MEVEPVGGKVRSVDVRIIAATNRDVEDAIRDGRFRDDLYYRLAVIPIDLPPLRQRPEDIPLLIRHFLERFSPEESLDISDDAMACMAHYPWPGNIRELQNAVERLVVLSHGQNIEHDHLPAKICKDKFLRQSRVLQLPAEGYPLEEIEKEAVLQALARNDWNQTKAAAFLQIPRHTLIYRMEKYDIKKT
jgi:two-component system NtrC family response regulator